MTEADGVLFTRRTLVVSFALILLFGLVLYFQGRPAWCEDGLGLWTGAATGCTSQHLFDPYTLSHILHGVIFYWMLRPFAARFSLRQRMMGGLVLEITWEALENSPWVIDRYHTVHPDSRSDLAARNAVSEAYEEEFGISISETTIRRFLGEK